MVMPLANSFALAEVPAGYDCFLVAYSAQRWGTAHFTFFDRNRARYAGEMCIAAYQRCRVTAQVDDQCLKWKSAWLPQPRCRTEINFGAF